MEITNVLAGVAARAAPGAAAAVMAPAALSLVLTVFPDGAATTEGFQQAFAAAAGIAATGALLAVLLPRPQLPAENPTAPAQATPETEPLEER